MLISTLVLLLAAAEPTAAIDTERARAMAALPASDLDIQRGLMAAYQANPNKNVCVNRTMTGSRQPRQVCGTLASWFENRLPGEVARNEPPFQLVEGIKEQRRKTLARGGRGNSAR